VRCSGSKPFRSRWSAYRPIHSRSETGEKETDIQEFYSSDTNLGGQSFNTASRDPSGRLEIKEEGTYRIQLRDLFNIRADPRRSYRLSIRRETPDFDLIALMAPPPTFEKDKREAQIWSSFLRRNDSILIKVLAVRRDNFAAKLLCASMACLWAFR
jgi:hypothetical protein